MKPAEIEAKVLQIVANQKSGRPLEDMFVELKREWIPADKKAAERIAGLGNAAQGQPVLWIVGLSETEGVIGAADAELANWWPQVQKHFDGISPELGSHMNVYDDESKKTLAVLEILTDRAPYVVNSENGKRVVPFRSGTRTEPATRAQLLRILVPLRHVPHVDTLLESVTHIPTKALELRLHLYLTPTTSEPIFLPKHLMKAHAVIDGEILNGTLKTYDFQGTNVIQEGMIQGLPTICVDSPGLFIATFRFGCDGKEVRGKTIHIKYSIGIAGSTERSIVGDFSKVIDPPLYPDSLVEVTP